MWLLRRYLIKVFAVRPIAGGSRRTGSTGVPRIVKTLHTGHALIARVRRAARARLMKT